MNVARHHNEWLSLVEVSGPFLSLPVLLRVFPQGLDSRDPSQASRLRDAYEDWLERGTKTPAVHRAWIRLVLDDVLAYPANLLAEGQAIPPGLDTVMATFSETLRPDMVLKHRETDQKPILLISVYPPNQDLQKPVSGKLWKASPGTRMMELLHAADVPIGLVTNGEEWMLVSARRNETTGFASWYADLWMQEPLTLRAFHSLLHLRRLIGVPAPETLSGLLIESSKDQQEVTDQLGYQVRDAVEVLVQAFDRIDAESGRTLLAQVDEKTLYDGALTVMMRLVFLFSAEERGLLLLGDPLYDQNYAVSTLSELLRERADQHGEEVLERRHDAWCRLLATFRAVHGGVEHEAMRLPPYGGTLFDPDRYPFLEGRSADRSWQSAAAKPLVINNRVVLHLLEALQVLRIKVPGGGPAEARRLSFSALDIEQIGHVYEGLLDHTAERANEPVLGLSGSKEKEPEIPLAKLEELLRKGTLNLVEFLHEETARSERALRRLIDEPVGFDEYGLLTACHQDEELARRIKPFAALLRQDSFGQLVVVPPGSVYVTAGSDRRSTGTHYTPRSLTEPIVKYTLEPLVYIGPAEGLPEAEWTLKSPKELLALRVCDLAMGSGAFLVETCRYLADRLVEAWENTEREHPGSFIVTPDGELSTGMPTERLIPIDSSERVAIARRYVADRSIYGVDINPMAVEMAKLSLWLVTLQRDRPFSFLDHALKCGDSLLGVSSLKQIENFSLRSEARQITFATAELMRHVGEASKKRRALEALPSNDHTQIETKNMLHTEAEAATAQVRALADVLIGFELRALDGEAYEDQRGIAAARAEEIGRRSLPELNAYAHEQLHGRRTFNWPVQFPEIFDKGGFDGFVGNPPFMGGTRISTVHGTDYLQYLGNSWPSFHGRADLCALFFLRAHELLKSDGTFGLLATNTIAQGDTREAGLACILRGGATIFRGISSMQWPGHAGLAVSVVHISKKPAFDLQPILDGLPVASISAFLDTSIGDATVHKLAGSRSMCFAGSKLDGMGFVLSPEEANSLLEQHPRDKEVVFPFLNADDVTSEPAQRASRYVINFFEWDESRARDYAECFQIVRDRVYPERQRHSEARTRQGWWRFQRVRSELYESIKGLTEVIVLPRHSRFMLAVLVDVRAVFSDALNVVASQDLSLLAVLQSDIHEAWARLRGSTLETRLRYTPTDCFETFPFPSLEKRLGDVGRKYHECRQRMMHTRKEGLTQIYNRFHSSVEMASDISELRALHAEMDEAVAEAMGFDNLVLGHAFRTTKQGDRYAISEAARRAVLERLLVLNHERHAQDLKTGLPSAGARKARRVKSRSNGGTELFG